MTNEEQNCPDFSLGYQAAHGALARWVKRRDEPKSLEEAEDRKWLES